MTLEISTTPLQLNLQYAEYPCIVDDIAPQKPAAFVGHAVVGVGHSLTDFGQGISNLAGAILLADESNDPSLTQQLQQIGVDAADPLETLAQLDVLPDLITGAWSSSHNLIVDAIESAIIASPQARSAGNIVVHVPPTGTLSALTRPVDTSAFPGLYGSAWSSATQLTLRYTVPGFTGAFTNENGDFSPTWNFSFDGEVDINIAIATDPRVAPRIEVAFRTFNGNVSPGNVWAGSLDLVGWLIDVVVEIATWGLAAGPVDISGSLPDGSTSSAGLAGASPLFNGLRGLWLLFAQAYQLGFTALVPVVSADALFGATPGNTVELRLIHPLEGPPMLTLATRPGLFIIVPQIVLAPPQVVVAGSLQVTGSEFPLGQAGQLTVRWTDPSPFVRASYVAWGPTNTGQPPADADIRYSQLISRSGSFDGHNTYTTPEPLTPGTGYAFLVQDLDLPTFLQPTVPPVSSEQSAWTLFQTTATDQVDLVLDYDNTYLGFGTLLPDGTFSTTLGTPASVPPGRYVITANLGSQVMAQAAVTVVGQPRELRPVLQILTPTSAPVIGVAVIAGGVQLTVQGFGFPLGPVELTVDTMTGDSLGTATATNPSGAFTQSIIWPLGAIGSHTVLARSSGGGIATLLEEATTDVFAQPSAQ